MSSKATYHHGDLRAALVRAAMELLEESGETGLSLHAVARRAGVSAAAPYRHYADREALAYVRFALERPALFRMMFGEPCDRDNDERVAATAAVSQYVRGIVERTFPQADAEALATAIWALVHGLAFLHLDGKLVPSTPSVVAERITAAIHALLTATNIGPDAADQQ